MGRDWVLKYLALTIALLSWFAVTAQFFISIDNASLETFTLVIRFFSYFTILTNLIVAVCSTSLALFPKKPIGLFFSKRSTLTAVTLYILLVGLVYNVLLRALWQPHGMAKIVDELLHSVIPLLVLIYWWCDQGKGGMGWKDLLGWLIYPFIYLLYTLGHGAISGFYPYPFVDVNTLGWSTMLINSCIVAVAVLLIGAILIGIARFKAQESFK